MIWIFQATLWQSNMQIEHVTDDFPIKTSIYRGFSIASLITGGWTWGSKHIETYRRQRAVSLYRNMQGYAMVLYMHCILFPHPFYLIYDFHLEFVCHVYMVFTYLGKSVESPHHLWPFDVLCQSLSPRMSTAQAQFETAQQQEQADFYESIVDVAWALANRRWMGL